MGIDPTIASALQLPSKWVGLETRAGSPTTADLPPGKHTVTLQRQGSSGLQTVGSTEVEPTDQNISGVAIAPFEPARVPVRVALEGEENPLTVGSVFLNPIDSEGNLRAGRYQFTPDNGTYIVNDVAPGKYLVGFTNVAHCFLKSVTSDGHELKAEQPVEVSSGADLDLALTYSKNVATVSGDVEASQDRLKNQFT